MPEGTNTVWSKLARAAGVIGLSILLSCSLFLVPPVIGWIQNSTTPSDFWRLATAPLSNEIMLSGLIAGTTYGLMIAALYYILRLVFGVISGRLRRNQS